RLALLVGGLSIAVWPQTGDQRIGHFVGGFALAQPGGSVEKDAFEAAKALGTVEAWDAFLANYPTGFHADLARAYVKKLAEEPAAALPSLPPVAGGGATPAPSDVFPAPAGSWGGIVRAGPGQGFRKVASLNEGEPVTLLERSQVFENGFAWFKIAYRGGRTGFKWGGILCSTGAERPDIFKTCTAPVAGTTGRNSSQPALSFEQQLQVDADNCSRNGGEWDGRRCRPAGFFDKPPN
ncbi:MAG: SH3 domain-containing protein, partial [Hyphomicrobium sp.]